MIDLFPGIASMTVLYLLSVAWAPPLLPAVPDWRADHQAAMLLGWFCAGSCHCCGMAHCYAHQQHVSAVSLATLRAVVQANCTSGLLMQALHVSSVHVLMLDTCAGAAGFSGAATHVLTSKTVKSAVVGAHMTRVHHGCLFAQQSMLHWRPDCKMLA